MPHSAGESFGNCCGMIACGKELFIVPKGLATITQTYALIGLSMNTVIGASDAARPAIGRRIVWNEQQSYHTGCIKRIDFVLSVG